jgi:putative GTP pyrophosphokinase
VERDVSPILVEYARDYGLYSDFTNKLDVLIRELLKQKGIHVHSITSRVKDIVSLRGKLARSNGKYLTLREITDLVGIRIITYYNDEVDAIATVMEEEFQTDYANSVDKRELLDPDRFGYLSLHYVIGLPQKRLELIEYQRFEDCKAEIQIRSILQHTWAEIEHDLGYKSKQAIPKDIRRSFSRLAGLLELADLEFVKIRDSLLDYETEVQEQVAERPGQVLIDQASLKSYINSSLLLQEVDLKIVTMAGVPVTSNEHFIGNLVDNLHFLGLQTISDVETLLFEHRNLVIEFARQVIAENRMEVMTVGISLFYLCNVIVGSSGSLEKALAYLQANYRGNPAMHEMLAREILTYYMRAKDTTLPRGDLR